MIYLNRKLSVARVAVEGDEEKRLPHQQLPVFELLKCQLLAVFLAHISLIQSRELPATVVKKVI